VKCGVITAIHANLEEVLAPDKFVSVSQSYIGIGNRKHWQQHGMKPKCSHLILRTVRNTQICPIGIDAQVPMVLTMKWINGLPVERPGGVSL
jgi:hypothetical protein